MWKSFGSIGNGLAEEKLDMDSRTNLDCLMHVLSHLSVREKVKCRSVCKTWREAVDKLFAGQRQLQLIYRKKKNEYKCGCDDSPYYSVVITNRLRFQLFHQMMTNFPSVHSLLIKSIPLSDATMLVIHTSCRYLSTINFDSCSASSQRNDTFNASSNTEDIYNGSQLSTYGWQMLINSYTRLKCLTLTNCSLTDVDCEKFITGFPELKSLDIADNNLVTGSCLNLLGENCESLCVGSLTTDLWLYPVLESISQSKAKLKHLELRGGINQLLIHFKYLPTLESLTIKYFCPQDQTIDTFSTISYLRNLRELVLHQDRCYDEPSAIDVYSFVTIVNECPLIKNLMITGEYGWRLRLNDYAINILANKCQLLEQFSLTGNSSEITNLSVQSLVLLPRLRSVSLTSFELITDEGLIHLISRHPALDYIGIKETSSVSNATLNACIQVAKSDPNRRLSLFFAETKISRPKMTKLPHNLKVVFEENLRPRRQSDEPSAMKMIAVVGMSAVILAMILITMLVVIVMPVGMLLMMFYDNCVEYAINSSDIQLDKNNPLDIFQFYAVKLFQHIVNHPAFIYDWVYIRFVNIY